MIEEKRIYCVVAASIQVPQDGLGNTQPKMARSKKTRTVLQPHGRQIAQACHVVSKLRWAHHLTFHPGKFSLMTTIILQARDSAELGHVFSLLNKKKLMPTIFSDENPEYGQGSWPTAVAVLASKKQIADILDYLPLWGTA
jgi:hypothetical protein